MVMSEAWLENLVCCKSVIVVLNGIDLELILPSDMLLP